MELQLSNEAHKAETLCDEWAGKPPKEPGGIEELEEVWRLVGGASDERADTEVESREDAELAYPIDAKASRLTAEFEGGRFVFDGWKEKVLNETVVSAVMSDHSLKEPIRRGSLIYLRIST
ncbi:hypothetical protein HOY80DRAFT_1061151 [Tuber brumale]|nr:hypothetical protein HOY80DRAFT_1061151 [Tuber brumale]